MILGDIQNVVELETKHKERLCKLRLNGINTLLRRKFNKLFSASCRCEKLSKLVTAKWFSKKRNERSARPLVGTYSECLLSYSHLGR